jgi:hypothetical protein
MSDLNEFKNAVVRDLSKIQQIRSGPKTVEELYSGPDLERGDE